MNLSDNQALLITIITSFAATIPGVIALIGQRTRDKATLLTAETASMEAQGKLDSSRLNDAFAIIDKYREEVAGYRVEQKELEDAVDALREALRERDLSIETRDKYILYLVDGIRKLVNYIKEMGLTDIPFAPMTLAEFEAYCAPSESFYATEEIK